MLRKSQKARLKIVMLDKESNTSTLWRQEEFLKIGSEEDLAEKAQDVNKDDNTSQTKSRGTAQPRSRGFLHKLFVGQATGWGRNQ